MLYARLKTNFHTNFHNEKVQKYLLHHYPNWYLWLDNIVLFKVVYWIPNAIVCLQFDYQEKNENLDTLIVIEYQVDVSIIGLKGYAVPCIEREALFPLLVPCFLLNLLFFAQVLELLLFELGLPAIIHNKLINAHSHHIKSCRKGSVNESVYIFHFYWFCQLIQLVHPFATLKYEIAIIIFRLVY